MEKTQQINQLPPEGLSRWRQLKNFIPFSHETWRKLVLAGKAPAPTRMGTRCTYWKNSEILEFLADIPGYRAPAKRKTTSSLKTGG